MSKNFFRIYVDVPKLLCEKPLLKALQIAVIILEIGMFALWFAVPMFGFPLKYAALCAFPCVCIGLICEIFLIVKAPKFKRKPDGTRIYLTKDE